MTNEEHICTDVFRAARANLVKAAWTLSLAGDPKCTIQIDREKAIAEVVAASRTYEAVAKDYSAFVKQRRGG